MKGLIENLVDWLGCPDCQSRDEVPLFVLGHAREAAEMRGDHLSINEALLLEDAIGRFCWVFWLVMRLHCLIDPVGGHGYMEYEEE